MAIFAASDEMAVGVLSEAYEQGMNIPKDFSVLGYDNTMAAEMAIPPLTTVAQPLDEMGKQAVSLLLKIRENPKELIINVDAKHEIIERNTVALRKITRGLFMNSDNSVGGINDGTDEEMVERKCSLPNLSEEL
jgi:LacI family transcriptional regulator